MTEADKEKEEKYVHVGSASYEEYEGQQFNIGLYIESAVPFGEYSLTMTYDPSFMEYVSGAASGGGGKRSGNVRTKSGGRGKYRF